MLFQTQNSEKKSEENWDWGRVKRDRKKISEMISFEYTGSMTFYKNLFDYYLTKSALQKKNRREKENFQICD